MPLARVKVWSSGEVLTASDLNAEINNILTNPGTLVSPMFVPLLHADGTIAAPGMSWYSEPSTGFSRLSTTVMAAIVNGANNMQWQPSHTFCFTALNLNNSQAINFYNVAGNALWEVLHANAANTLHVGRIGWGSTTIYGGGAGNLVVHGGGVTLSGTVTGISGATIGLPQVSNWYQVRELRNGANTIYIGWDGGGLDLQVDGTYKGRLWPIDIEGASRRLWNANSGVGMTFHWAGQGGQPSWLWGGNDGSNMYVYNPSNFNVNYANSSDSTRLANYLTAHGMGTMTFHWSVQGSPHYLWGNWSGGDHYMFSPGSLSVNYANSAGSANTCNSANYASSTNYANSAGSTDNSNKVSGIGPWNWDNRNHNPVHVWANDGGTNDQFLVSPGNLSVGYAANAGHASYADSAGSGGGTDGLRAKDNIADSVTNASTAIDAVRIIEFDDKLVNRHFSTGFLPANLETIDSGMVYHTVFPGDPRDGPKDTLNVNPITILAYAVKALQELSARIKALEARL